MVNIGVHVVAVKAADGKKVRQVTVKAADGKKVRQFCSVGSIFVSVSDGKNVRQFEPGMSLKDQAWLRALLYNPTNPKVGCDIVWHALDLYRLFRTEQIMAPLITLADDEGYQFPIEFPVWMEYKLTDHVKKRSGLLARAYARGGIYLKDKTSFVRGWQQSIVVSNLPTLWKIYEENLILFRMKWLEIQGVTKELRGYKIEQLESNEAEKSFGIFRYVLEQTVWSTHMMDGTILKIHVGQNRWLQPDIMKVDKRRVKFRLAEPLDVNTIQKSIIIRGGEKQSQIIKHLRQGLRVLTDAYTRRGGLMWCSQYFGLPQVVDEKAAMHFASEQQKLRDFVLTKPEDMDADDWEYVLVVIEDARKWFVDRWDVEKKEMCLNDEQRQCATSMANTVICDGYPGSGKTKTLAALVHSRFGRLMTQPAGWIMCVTHTNSAALSIVEHISRYPSLEPYLRYSYSKMYAAFHIPQFGEETNRYTIDIYIYVYGYVYVMV